MKKVLRLLAFITILTSISLGAIKNVNATAICENSNEDNCDKKEYKFDKYGNPKEYQVTIGVYHLKKTDPNGENKEILYSFDNCGYSNTGYCKLPFRIDYINNILVPVNSATSVFPKAICAQPGEQYGVTQENYTKYIYFTDEEIAAQTSCDPANIFYTEDTSETTKPDNRVCEKVLTSYTIEAGVKEHQISTNFHQAGPDKICSVNITYNNNQNVNYNHYNSTVSCKNENYKFVCQDIGDPTKSGDQCYLYECDEKTNSKEVGFTCKLRNDSNYNDYVEVSFVKNEDVRNPSAMNTQFGGRYYISKDGKLWLGSMKNYLRSYTESCPDYVYYDKDREHYFIFNDMVHFEEYQKNNKNHTYIKYSFTNASDKNILYDDNVTDEGIPNYLEGIPDRPKYTGDRHCGIFGDTTWDIINTLYGIVKVLIPVLVVILGMIDFASVVFSGEDKDMKIAGQRFVKRIIIGIVLLLLPAILGFIFNLVGFSEGCLAELIK